MTERRVLPTNRSKGPTGKQSHLIRQLRREVGEARGRMPSTRLDAAREIDRLLTLKGRGPARPVGGPPRSENARALRVSIARDLAHALEKDDLRDEQARLKRDAAERRAGSAAAGAP